MPSIKQVLPTKKQICRGDQWSPAVVRKRASRVQKGRRKPPMNLPAAKFTLSAKRLRDCFERKTNLLQSLRHGKPCPLPLHKGGFLFVRFVHFADSGFKIILCQQAETDPPSLWGRRIRFCSFRSKYRQTDCCRAWRIRRLGSEGFRGCLPRPRCRRG